MSRGDEVSRIEELRRALTRADSSAFLVEGRVIRRVIREQFGFAKLSASIPHTESQVVAADDVRHLTHPDELGLITFSELPTTCLLINQPEEGELEHWPLQELQQQLWRRLFHAQIDRELLQKCRTSLKRSDVQERIAEIGQVEFDEAHFVLRSEHRLIEPESRIEAWREFVALYSELQRFEPDLLSVWFPSLAGRPHLKSALMRDVKTEEIFTRTRLYGATVPDLTPHVARDEASLLTTRRNWTLGTGIMPSDRAYVRLLRRRERNNERGNTVAAIVNAIMATQRATSNGKRAAATDKARADIHYLTERLRRAIEFRQEETENWQSSLWELATNSVHGFWNSEKRLLYDLQKVCLDHERVNYKVDLVKWIVSRGRRPLRRPLTNLREVTMAKHLASAASRLVYVRLSGIERERLTQLLHDAARLAEEQMRTRMRPALSQTLLEVELTPKSVPEQVAFDKLVEDSLDCIASRGYLTMGYLRDAISKNDLKLPDLTQLKELYLGDHLLRADDRLDVALDGVYRRGEFYLRWLQITSSLFFGTRAGRFATQFLIIPFGGALVIVEGVIHVAGLFNPTSDEAAPENVSAENGTAEKSQDKSNPLARLGDSKSGDAGETASEETASADEQDLFGRTASDVAAVTDDVAAATLVGEASDANHLDESLTAALGQPETESSFSGTTAKTELHESIGVTPRNADDASEQIVEHLVEMASWVLVIGFLLLFLINVARFRRWFFRTVGSVWRFARRILIDFPLKVIHLPLIQTLLRHRTIVRIRRLVLMPTILSLVGTAVIPWLLTGEALSGWWTGSIAILLSMALNSRLGRDAQELTAEWVGNAWYKLRARVVMAVIDWIIDMFRLVLNLMERFLYAVDELLRFHSDESWLSIVAKAFLGVIWSFVSFILRIYVNLLIEPTLNPVKHFPVVTVAHKMFLPMITLVGEFMLHLFRPYLGVWMAGLFTGFNIFFLPGIFGFLVWELKENWRLYQSNRKNQLTPVAVGSHGETVARLLRPGFHSGTLPKLFRRLRRLEHQEASLRRFSARRAGGDQLEHVEKAIRSFVEREFISLLKSCLVWKDTGLRCGHIHAASNSFYVEIECSRLGSQSCRLLFQEQSGWVVASVPNPGWLRFASGDQLRSFQNALLGFYRKSGIDLIREQLEANLIHNHPYDIDADGFAIWPDGHFDKELTVDLSRNGVVRPMPSSEAAAVGILPADRKAVVFAESTTEWTHWQTLWTPVDGAGIDHSLPLACSQLPAEPVLRAIR
ncbi:MAG TPA: hypothetical protein PLY87_12940 [Planctomycetaceae bacterium]|nr:hypothetical protein [Planctomycetaceae bacterium]